MSALGGTLTLAVQRFSVSAVADRPLGAGSWKAEIGLASTLHPHLSHRRPIDITATLPN